MIFAGLLAAFVLAFAASGIGKITDLFTAQAAQNTKGEWTAELNRKSPVRFR
jgi:hypothetical protein